MSDDVDPWTAAEQEQKEISDWLSSKAFERLSAESTSKRADDVPHVETSDSDSEAFPDLSGLSRNALELLARTMHANHVSYAANTQKLIDMLRRDEAAQHAKVQLIQEAVAGLMQKPYAPSSKALSQAIYPSRQDVVTRRDELLEPEDE